MGVQRVAAIDALLADEVEVPGLVALHGHAPVAAGRRHVGAREVDGRAAIDEVVIEGAPE